MNNNIEPNPEIRVARRFKAWLRPAGLCALALMLAACKTGPDYKRPDLKTPERYKSATVQEAKEPGLDIAWWRLFQDPDLNALEDEALSANQNLKAAVARVAQARASAASVKSGFFPVVTMDPSAMRSRKPVTVTSTSSGGTTASRLNQTASVLRQVSSLLGGTSSSSSTSSSSGSTQTSTSGTVSTVTGSTGNSFSIPFDLSYEIDLWGRVRRSYESAQADLTVSVYELEVVRQTLLADVAKNYFNLRALDAQDEILTRNLALYQEQVELTQQKYTSGLITETDVLQAKTQLESKRVNAADIRRQRADAEHAIAILLGRAPADFSLAARSLSGTPPVIPAGMPGDILRRRPDVAEAEQSLAGACAQIGVAKAEFFPTVKITGSAGFETTEIKDVVNWKNRAWSIGPSLSLPIFEGGKLRANLRKAKARYDELEATYRNTVLTAYGEVEDCLTDLHLRADASEAQNKAVETAREYFRLIEMKYRNGVSNYLDVVDAEQTLLTQELSAVTLLSERMSSTVLLMKALGGGWNPPPAPASATVEAVNPVASSEKQEKS